MSDRRVWVLLAVALLGLAGCGEYDPLALPEPPAGQPQPPEPTPPVGDPEVGGLAFTDACAGCHNSRDGLDLVAFGYADHTVMRRAVAHVDTATARDILAHLGSLSSRTQHLLDGHTAATRLFQPGGRILPTDRALAMELFGADGWPEDLSSDELRSLDPRDVPVALPFPRWSDEGSNLDWMPDAPIPLRVLDANDGRARGHLEAYYENASEQSLEDAVAALGVADRLVVDAPCSKITAPDYGVCFDVRRWTATLTLQHFLRNPTMGGGEALPRWMTEPWWEVGQASRRMVNAADSVGTSPAIDHALENWLQWMYVGWIFDPGREPSPYLARGLVRAGLPKHAVFTTLRTLVDREPGDRLAYHDARTVARYAPPEWSASTLSFAYRNLAERLDSGERLDAADVDDARWVVEVALDLVRDNLDPSELTELTDLRNEVLDRLP